MKGESKSGVPSGIHRVEVIYTVPDARGKVRARYFNGLGLKGKVSKVTVVDAYTIDARLKATDLSQAAELLTNPRTQKSAIDAFISPGKFDYCFEVGFLPGVTDNVAHSARETIADGVGREWKKTEGVYTSRLFFC